MQDQPQVIKLLSSVLFKGFRGATIFAAVAVLAACGGGSSVTAITEPSSLVLDASQASNISVQNSDSGSTVLSVPAGSTLAANITVGQGLQILPGTDARFPLGFAANVSGVSVSTTGETRVALAPTSLATAFSSVSVNAGAVALNADNFVGVISPPAVRSAGSSSVKLARWQNGVSVLDGGIVLRTGAPGFVEKALDAASGSTSVPGEIVLALEIKLAEMVDDPSTLKPFGKNAEAKVSVSGKITDLMLTNDIEYKKVLGVPVGLNSMDMRVAGKLNADVNIAGGFRATLGYFSQAWNAVKKKSVEVLGVSAEISGLDSKDKVGKYPIFGLVFSVTCPSVAKCAAGPGSTQAPLRDAKYGGVIVWVYLTASGELKVDGAVGTRINDQGFNMGMVQTSGASLDGVFELTHTGNSNVLDAVYVDGSVEATTRRGLALDVDVFTLGIRVANAGALLGAQDSIKVSGKGSYGIPNWGQPFDWSGQVCMNSASGAGAIFSVSADIGATIKTEWPLVGNADKTFKIGYAAQWPKEEEISVPGVYRIMGRPAWHTTAAANYCYPAPKVESVSCTQSGRIATYTVKGRNLPPDLVLARSGCLAPPEQTAWSASSATYSCTLNSGATCGGAYAVSSASSSNLDSSGAGSIVETSPSSTSTSTTTTVTALAGITAVTEGEAGGYAPVARGGTTTSSTPIVNGTLTSALSPGYLLRLYDGNTLLGVATVNGRTWTFVPQPLLVGEHSFIAVVTRADGLESGSSAAWSFKVTCAAGQVAVANGSCAGSSVVQSCNGISYGPPSVGQTSADVGVALTLPAGLAQVGSVIAATVTLTNNGPGVARNVTTTVTKPDASQISYSVASLASGATATFTPTYTVGTAAVGSTLSWAAASASSTPDWSPCNATSTASIVVGTSTAAAFFDDFSSATLDVLKWTQSGSAVRTSGEVTFSPNAFYTTSGKIHFSGSKIVVEGRFAGLGASRDTAMTLFEVGAPTSELITIHDTTYAGWGFEANGGGKFNFVEVERPSGIGPAPQNATTLGGSTNQRMEYRMTLEGNKITIERGVTLSNITQSATRTLGTSIAGRSFYLLIGGGGPIYPPGTFDWVRVTTQ